MKGSAIKPGPSRKRKGSVTKPAPSGNRKGSVTKPGPSGNRKGSVTKPGPSNSSKGSAKPVKTLKDHVSTITKAQVSSTHKDVLSSEAEKEDEDQTSSMVLINQAPTKFCWVGVRASKSYKLSTGREVKQRCVRIGKIIKIDGEQCKVDFFKQRKSGLWGKDGSGSDDVPLNDVIVIQPPANRWDKNDKPAQWAYDFHTNITNIIISYFEK